VVHELSDRIQHSRRADEFYTKVIVKLKSLGDTGSRSYEEELRPTKLSILYSFCVSRTLPRCVKRALMTNLDRP